MNVRTIVFVLAALLIAGGTAFVARGLLTQKPVPTVVQQETSGKKVLVAKTNLPAGTLIKEEDVEWQKWPEDGINAAYLVEGQADVGTIAGAVVRRGIAAGGPDYRDHDRPSRRPRIPRRRSAAGHARHVHRSRRADRDLRPSFPRRSRRPDAAPCRCPSLKGVDGEEVVGPHSFEPHTAETFLEDIRVIAIDRIINDIEGQEPQKLSTVTVELTPKQVEMVHAVRDIGDLALSLRGLATDKQPAGTPVASISGTKTPSRRFPQRVADRQNSRPRGRDQVRTPSDNGVGRRGVHGHRECRHVDIRRAQDSDTVLDPFADSTVPERGDSVTYDYEVSRALEDRMLKSHG